MKDSIHLEKMFVLHTLDNRIEISMSIGYRLLSVTTAPGLLTVEDCTAINEALNVVANKLNTATEKKRQEGVLADLEKEGVVKVQS